MNINFFQIQKSPNYPRGGGGQENYGLFPQIMGFFILNRPLTYNLDFHYKRPNVIICIVLWHVYTLELTSRQDFPRCMSYNKYIRHVGKCSFYILVFSKSANTAIVGKFSFLMCLSVHIFSVLKGEGCTNFLC